MGGTACHYASPDMGNNGCSSFPSNSILNAGTIVGIVIGSLVGITIIIALLIITCELLKRNNSLPHQPRHMDVYGVRTHSYQYQQSPRRPDTYITTKPSAYPDGPTYYDHYNDV